MNYKKLFGWAAGSGATGLGLYSWLRGTVEESFIKTTAQELRNAENPSKVIFDKMAEEKSFKTPENVAKIDTLRQDAKFTTALNNAIKNNPTMADGLVRSFAGGTGPMNPDSLLNSMQNGQTRSFVTGALEAIAKPEKGLNYNYLEELANDAHKVTGPEAKATKEDRVKLQETLAKSGQKDFMLDASLDPMKALNSFWRDPSGTVRSLFANMGDSLKGMPEGLRNMLVGFVDLAANAVGAMTDPKGDFVRPYIELGKQVGGRLEERGADVLGHTIEKRSDIVPSKHAALDDGKISNQSAMASFNDNATGERTDGYKTPSNPERQVAYNIQPSIGLGMTA